MRTCVRTRRRYLWRSPTYVDEVCECARLPARRPPLKCAPQVGFGKKSVKAKPAEWSGSNAVKVQADHFIQARKHKELLWNL